MLNLKTPKIMTLEEFVQRFAEEFDQTPVESFQADMKFKDLDEWSSLTALSIISMVDEEFDKQITGADLRKADTIEQLYDLIISK